MGFRGCLTLLAIIASLALSATAEAASVHLSGSGWARINARSANVWSIKVPRGTVRFRGHVVSSLYCVSGKRRATCAKRIRGRRGMWAVSAPTGFLAQGKRFTATIASRSVFDLNMQGKGTLTVSGKGTVVIRRSRVHYSGFSVYAIR